MGPLLFLAVSLTGAEAKAQLFPSVAALAASVTSTSVANTLVKTIGIALDFRPMEPATPLGSQIGLDIGFASLTLLQVPAEFTTVLQQSGVPISLPILPDPNLLVIHKGLGDRVDIGGTYLPPLPIPYLANMWWWAVDLKVAVIQPEEGPTIAGRISFTQVHIPQYQNPVEVDLDTQTVTTEILASRKLDFIDPYIGIGYQAVYGTTKYSTASLPGLAIVTPGQGGSFLAFGGLSAHIPYLGVRLTLEGAYSSAGANSLGTKLSLSL